MEEKILLQIRFIIIVGVGGVVGVGATLKVSNTYPTKVAGV